MIQAKEVRIGNWVNDRNKPVDLKPSQLVNLIEGRFDDLYSPIPLTEEWLMKFSFVNNNWTDEGKPIYYGFSKDDFAIQNIDDNLFLDGYMDSLNIKYVHQLQNLYFALTGLELTVSS